MKREFTGRHMTAILVFGFGVIVAVNLLMATLALRGFGGVVVENSYVASQRYNGWLEEAERQKALGWSANVVRREDGRLAIETRAVPVRAKVSATLRRPLGKPQATQFAFTEVEPGRFVSTRAVAPGRWIVRLNIDVRGKRWSHQETIG